jgi:integrase
MTALALRRPALVRGIRSALRNARSEATWRAYKHDWESFKAWAAASGVEPLPASPETLAAYLVHMQTEGLAPATWDRALAGIGQAHEAAGMPSPRGTKLVRETRKGLRRQVGVRQRQAAPLLAEHVRAIAAAIPDSLIGKRDLALLLLGWSAALRRSELVGLDIGDATSTDRGLDVFIAKSKTDQEGRGQVVSVPESATLSVPAALRAWIGAAALSTGPLFVGVRQGAATPKRLSTRDVARVVKRWAKRIGLDPALFSGHSLRAGFLTTAAESGKSVWAMQRQSRHKSIEMVAKYVRAADRHRDNAAAGLL